MMAMDEAAIEELLSEVPFEERWDVREFLHMNPDRQRIHTYRETKVGRMEIRELREHVDDRFDRVLKELAEIRKPGYAKVGGAIVAGVVGVLAYLNPNHIPGK